MRTSETLKKFIKFEAKIKLITVQNVAKVPTNFNLQWMAVSRTTVNYF